MYDPVETDISYEYLQKLKEKITDLRWAVLGGWAVFLQVKDEYQKAFGKEYLRSRDIDVFVDHKNEQEFFDIIKGMGFTGSAYSFRYELIYDRGENKIISSERSKQKPIFNLVYIFLDVFSDKKTKMLGSWVFPKLENMKTEEIEGCPVFTVDSLLNLKVTSFFEREKLDKELKDACDIFALLFYSGKKFKINVGVKKAADKIISRFDLQEYIAEQVLGDNLIASLVKRMLEELKK